MKDNTKVLGALVLGAAAGAVLGLLFAPSSGDELRKKIKDNAGDILDDLTDKINEGKETLADLRDRAMNKAENLRSRAEEEFDNYSGKAKSTVNNNGTL